MPEFLFEYSFLQQCSALWCTSVKLTQRAPFPILISHWVFYSGKLISIRVQCWTKTRERHIVWIWVGEKRQLARESSNKTPQMLWFPRKKSGAGGFFGQWGFFEYSYFESFLYFMKILQKTKLFSSQVSHESMPGKTWYVFPIF